jgi:5-methylcytosine-specific restriction protein A
MTTDVTERKQRIGQRLRRLLGLPVGKLPPAWRHLSQDIYEEMSELGSGHLDWQYPGLSEDELNDRWRIRAANREAALHESVAETRKRRLEIEKFWVESFKTRASVSGHLNRAAGDLTKTAWVEILRAFDYCCAYCTRGKPLCLEHVIPVSKGGATSRDNVVPACRDCNDAKRTKRIEAWLPDLELHLFLDRWSFGDTYRAAHLNKDKIDG